MNALIFSYSNTTLTTPGFWIDEVTHTLENRIVTVCDGDDYRFGLKVLTEESVFNGMEKDNEVKGVGNSLDFGARIYYSMLGRWLSLDPLQTKYPSQSPYNFCMNSPLKLRDPDGKDVEVTIDDHSISFCSTIYITGTGASEMAAKANASWAKFSEAAPQNRTYNDAEEHVYEVHVSMNFVAVDETNQKEYEKVLATRSGTNGNNIINLVPPMSEHLVNGIRSNARHGKNNYKSVDDSYGIEQVGSMGHNAGNQIYQNNTDGGGVSIHDVFHNWGLRDRYIEAKAWYKVTQTRNENFYRTFMFRQGGVYGGFENDIMAQGFELSQTHIDNMCNKALSSKKSGTFVMSSIVDNANSMDKEALPDKTYSSGEAYDNNVKSINIRIQEKSSKICLIQKNKLD